MTADEARRRFAAARVARLATADAEGVPHLVPVVFAVDGDTIVVAVDRKPKRTTALKRLANVRANPRVALLADHYADDDWDALWWVRADGAGTVHEPGERAAVRAVELLAGALPAAPGGAARGTGAERRRDALVGLVGSVGSSRMSDASPTRYIWALLNEHGLLPELGDRSVRGGSPAVTFEEIIERVRGCPAFPMTPTQVDEALHQELWDGPSGDNPGRIIL